MSLLENYSLIQALKNKKNDWAGGKALAKAELLLEGIKDKELERAETLPAGFEGGAMPLARRLPKFGFTNAPFKTMYEVVNLSQLNQLEGKITPELLVSKGLVKKKKKIKVLGQGKSLKLCSASS